MHSCNFRVPLKRESLGPDLASPNHLNERLDIPLLSLSIISDFDRKRILKAVLVDILMIVCGIAGHLSSYVAFSGKISMG